MKKPALKILSIIIPVLIITGCGKNFILSNEQEVLFQYEYQNNAWGPHLEGFFIDKEGNVLKYKNPAEWNHPDKDLLIYKDQLSENLDRCTISEKVISSGELEKYARYISFISSSKISAPRQSGMDMGSYRYICYRFDETFKVYKGILIRMEGDFTRENLNFYSKKVVSWMKEIIEDISQ